MSADPAELIFFGDMSSQAVFDEAEQLGLSAESLDDGPTRQRVLHSRLLRIRTATAKSVAAGLGIEITDQQAGAIARNSLVPEVCADPAPLNPREREIAEELYYHAIKAAVARHHGTIAERAARSGARKMAAAGERGRTKLHRITRATGCLLVAAAIALASGSVLLSVVAVVLSA